MEIGNIVKEVLSYKKGQIERKLSSPQAFVSSRFQETLQSAVVKEGKANEQTKTKSEQVEDKNPPVETSKRKEAEPVQVAQKEMVRRFPELRDETADMWGLTKKYNIQKIRSEHEGKYMDIIDRVSRTYGIPKTLIQKMIEVESDFNPKTVSHAGAKGLMQLMPENVRELGVQNPFSPAESIEAGVKELAGYLKKNNGDLVLALASYNAGPGNVRKYGGVPPFKETEGYIKKILNIDVSK
ncbi:MULTISPECIES: lytic transglycosylase domain-containing protein [Bacillus cereus group]|nr:MULTISPECIES: lytic transglycosylase domain-containing protein [Bacillus cereus group]AWC28313.1 lytic transglycosylase domain-containing protein [Bacillus cytotoxicus]AWC40302.1 lytic transglycosylase domain-containing protein [Bacillus cytotoxicus]AWC48233.1 lytic transglycosylase domain-containing protein [Bacillus cytotoxicus]AWC52380.1 lytic transglycosylase domain-containing protein [Bacillus cytotoxicus]AWC56514.1 lytic transglycosylase domain-containing protein [Bacillus cytotoxicus